MSKLVKAIGRGIKKVFKAVKKVVKKITSSKLFTVSYTHLTLPTILRV